MFCLKIEFAADLVKGGMIAGHMALLRSIRMFLTVILEFE